MMVSLKFAKLRIAERFVLLDAAHSMSAKQTIPAKSLRLPFSHTIGTTAAPGT
jgi:hypothetical protein